MLLSFHFKFFRSNKNEITGDTLKSISLFILAGPQQKFNEIELESMKDFVNSGGSLMVLLAESGENAFDTNINFLLEEFGMNINSDSVVRQHYYKYFHPKEAVLNGCIVCENMNNELLKVIKKTGSQSLMDEKFDIEMVYPFGATINVISPSNTLITTSTIAYPFNRPVCGYFSNDNGGQILALGSGHVFTDRYIVNEHNMYVWDYFVTLLVEKSIKFKAKDFNDVEVCSLINLSNFFIHSTQLDSRLHNHPRRHVSGRSAQDLPRGVFRLRHSGGFQETLRHDVVFHQQ